MKRIKKVRKFMAMALCLCMLSGGMVAQASCPYCDTQCVRELSEHNHHYYDGFGHYPISHAEWVVCDRDRSRLTAMNADTSGMTQEQIDAIVNFKGVPIDLPMSPRGWAYYADGKASGFTYIVYGIGRSRIDIDNGTYTRYDGITYKFDPNLFAFVYETEYPNASPNVFSYTYEDLRFADWVCTNNAHLPDYVLNYMTKAWEYSVQMADLKAKGIAENADEMNSLRKQMYENYELALELLYGYLPAPEAATADSAIISDAN